MNNSTTLPIVIGLLVASVGFHANDAASQYQVRTLQGQSCEQNLACDMPKSDLSRSARVTATSSLDNSSRYGPRNVIDKSPDAPSGQYWGNPATAWCEGAPGMGLEETVRIDFAQPQPVALLTISAGYEKSLDLYTKNGRLREASLIFSDGSQYRLQFGAHFYDGSTLRQSSSPAGMRYPEMNSPQLFVIADEGQPPKVVDWLELSILKTAAGSKYSDTCISRIEITPRWDMDF